MTAKILDELKDRKREVENGDLAGNDLTTEVDRLTSQHEALKEKVANLPEDEARTAHLEKVTKGLSELKAATVKKSKKEVEEKEEEPEPTVEPKSEPEVPVDPQPEKKPLKLKK